MKPCFNGHSRYTSTSINKYTLFLYFSIFFSFFLIGKQRTIINERKKKREVQVVRDDERQEIDETNSKTKEREIKKII